MSTPTTPAPTWPARPGRPSTRSTAAPLAPELRDSLTEWVDAARGVATAIADDIAPVPFNDAINRLNDARSLALDLCDAAY